MERIAHDILIIGGGAAGLRAALAARKTNNKADVAIVSKVYPVRSHTVSAEGGIAGVFGEDDNFDLHAFDTIKGSDYLADQDAVEFFVRQCPREIVQLEHWGCPWSRTPDGNLAQRAFGGMSVKRTVYAADKTGFYMLHSLFERTLKDDGITIYNEWHVTSLVRDDSRVLGVTAINLHTGQLGFLSGKTVILATGGAGRLYRFTTNGNIKTGDGMALALRAGAPLKDMEFIQFHPTALPRTGILITEGARGEGGFLLNKNGARFLKNYLPKKMELGPRDLISRAIVQEIKEGRGIEGHYGAYVHLDLRHLGEKTINERLPLVREVSRDFEGVDPVREPIPVRPANHYTMGGVHTNVDTETPLAGLYAAGETACVTINGSNRLGSNSLAECLVFGAVAGRNAAEYAGSFGNASGVAADATTATAFRDEERRIQALLEQGNGGNRAAERVAGVREALHDVMEEHAGISRDEQSLREGVEKIQRLKERFKNISLDEKTHSVFNTDLTSLLELENMLDVAHALMLSAQHRKESRGAHVRTDFEKRDDENFLHHQLATMEHDELKFEKSSVTITKWQPAERKY